MGSGDPAVIVPAGAAGLTQLRNGKCVAAVKCGATISVMSLARAWRRQLYGASSAALIVPSAMLGALVVLAVGGGFNQVGVLGQIFAGPSVPGASGGALAAGHAGAPAHSLPPIPVAALGAGPSRPGTGQAGPGSGPGRTGAGPRPSHGPSQSGGAIGGVVPIVGGGSVAPVPSRPAPTGSAPTESSPPAGPSPQPQPQPRPTPVDRIVNTVTPVTQQLPGPVGPAATQAVQAAGSAADSVLPPGVGSSGAPVTPPANLKLP